MIIGLHGYKQSGKDTVADYLVENYGFKRVAFADKLKDAVCALFDIRRDHVERWKSDPYIEVVILGTNPFSDVHCNFTFRQFLQRIGTEMGRGVFGQNFWINLAMEQMDQNKDYVISDVRFVNEISAIQAQEGTIVLIDRPSVRVDDPHLSEKLYPEKCDFKVNNHSSLQHLYTEVDWLIQTLGRM